jgi:zinc transport system substrate-binding protein
MRRTYLVIVLLLMAMALGLSSCSSAPNYWKDASPGQKKILVSFPPLYAITHEIAGKDAYVLCMLSTQGPHDYDGGPTDLPKVNKADLFIFNGLSLDDGFAEKMLRNHKNRNLAVLNVGEVLDEKHHNLLLHTKHEEPEAEKKHDDHHDHKHGDHDPHIWLGPAQAIAMTNIIAAKLAAIDPAHAKGYEARAKTLVEALTKLKNEGDDLFKGKEATNIVTMHEAFGYFGQRKNFPTIKIVASIQSAPGVDPDASSIKRLVKICREKNVKVIAKEPQYSDRQVASLQQSLKREGIDVKVITLDPLETAELAPGSLNPDPSYYLKKMRENIETLAKALP